MMIFFAVHCAGRQAWGLSLLVLILLAAGFACGQDSLPASLTNDLKVHLWDYNLDVRGALGYKDNVLLSHTNRQGSALWDTGGDFMVFRLPSSSWQFNGFISGDDVRYFGGRSDHGEDSFLAVAKLTRLPSEHWTSSLGASYNYMDQIVDLTATAAEPTVAGPQRVVANILTGLWSARGEYGPNSAEIELSGTRQIFKSPLDSFWQAGPKLTLSRRLSDRSELSLSGQWSALLYDHLPELNASGNQITNTTLSRMSEVVQLSWHQVWDGANHWHTTMTATFEAYQDSGAGFNDFSDLSFSPKLEYRGAPWTLSASVRGSWYDYPRQIIEAPHILRTKTGLTANLHAERRISKALKLTANYDFDRSFSNLDTDDYYVHTFTIGAEWEF